METFEDIVCVILAGGLGKSMASSIPKACCPVLGRAAIVRAIDTYKSAGLSRFLIVVGQKAPQVLATVTDAHPEVGFAYQPKPLGTGHAAAVACEVLRAQGHAGAILVVMGDKVVRQSVVTALLEKFVSAPGADLVMAVLPKQPAATGGRVVSDRAGRVLGVVEPAEIAQASKTRRPITLAGRAMSAAEIERRSPTVNASVYLFRAESLYRAVERLTPSKVTHELYLTDVVADLAATGRVETMPVANPADLMAFNTQAELRKVEQVLRRLEPPRRVTPARRGPIPARILKPARQWANLLGTNPPALRRELQAIYGQNEDLIAERRRAMAKLAAAFAARHGPSRKVLLCRSPGRVNLMGRHVDHRGGYVNVMAINREVLLAVASREDDVVTLGNLDDLQFPPCQFKIGHLLDEFRYGSWGQFINSPPVRRLLADAPGDWSHYARAALLRLQKELGQHRLGGMDCLLSGDIPIGAGLSSSSALVVAFALAALAVNRLKSSPQDFVDLCGEGEWFVGSRGGSSDHAAILASRRGCVMRIGFFPFRLSGRVALPRNLQAVIAHSGSKALKSAAARDIFNQRVACYEIAEILLRRSSRLTRDIERLGDVNPQRLGVSVGRIIRLLKRLPGRATRRQLRRLIGRDDREKLEAVFATHGNLGTYDLRGVALFGIGECARSGRFLELLRAGKIDRLGRLMRISHDGDRRFRFDRKGHRRRWLVRTDDASLERLARSCPDLAELPGRYACSTEQIDELVDIAGRIEGVIGAQLAGAGLGGCAVILVKADAVSRLTEQLRQRYYAPHGLSEDLHACLPVAGAGILKV